MRSPQRRLSLNKRGLSGVVSGLFILVIALSMVIFIYETYQAQTQMSDWDAERVRERIEVSDVFFGETGQYSPNSVTPPRSQMASLEKLDDSYLQFNSSKGDQVVTPIINMNFTNGDDGWIFEDYPDARDIKGSYYIHEGNPSPGSGNGSMFVQMTDLSTGPYWMNWTYRFSYSQGPPEKTYFSWAKMVYDNHLVNQFNASVVLVSPNGNETIIRGPLDLSSLSLKSWYYESLQLDSSIISYPGTYSLTLAVNCSTQNSGNPHDSGNVVVFFDDVGISIVLGQTFSTDFYGTFNTGKVPDDLHRLRVYYAGRYAPWSGTLMHSPTSVTTSNGTSIIGGSYQSLDIKDGNVTSFRSAPAQLIDWYGEFTIQGFASLDQVDVFYWGYFNTSAIAQTMYIYNWNTSAYDQIGTNETYSTAEVGQWHNRTINSDLTKYVSSSHLRIRILSEYSHSFDSYADFLNIGVTGTGGGKTSVQKLYIMDYANDQWHLLANSNVAANDEMVGPVEISESISSYVDVQGTILVRVCSESETLVNCQANFMMIRLYSVNVSKITLEVTNLGSETVNLVRIYVVNSTGHSKIDLSTGMNIDRTTISPGEQALIQIDYPYSTCQYTFKVITKRGTIGAYVKTAS